MTEHRVKEKQFVTEKCFGCGIDNHQGLHGVFYTMEDEKTVALFQLDDRFQGYPQRLHGGIIATMLDETIGRAILAPEPECWAVTAELSIRYRKPVPFGVPLKIIAEVTENTRRFFRGSGRLILPDGELAATAQGTYVKQSLESIANPEEIKASVGRILQEADVDTFDY